MDHSCALPVAGLSGSKSLRNQTHRLSDARQVFKNMSVQVHKIDASPTQSVVDIHLIKISRTATVRNSLSFDLTENNFEL